VATKAERFNEQLQLEKHHKPKQARHPKPPSDGSHNESPRAAQNSAYELEPPASPTSRPSRKSSRKSTHHRKNDGQLKLAVLARNAAPSQRASRPSGNPN